MSLIVQFLTPYLQLCYLAAWGIAQNLEGLGLFKYINSPILNSNGVSHYVLNYSPTQGVTLVSLFLTLILLFIFCIHIRACFYLGAKIGVAAVMLWILPGILAIYGIAYDVHSFVPDKFVYGEGFPGGVGPVAANVLILIIMGWSVVMLIGSFWKRDRFKNLYDHIWYPLGLIAVLYFVIDAGLPSYKGDMDNANNGTVQLLSLYADFTKNIEETCIEDTYVLSQAKHLCAFTKDLSWKIKNDLSYDKVIRAHMHTSEWVELLGNEKNDLNKEIQIINAWGCDAGNLRKRCLKIPLDAQVDIKNMHKDYLFLPLPYAKRLQQYELSLKKADKKIRDIEQGHNIRYFAFLMVAFLAGGKVANVTRALLDKDRNRPKSWLVGLLKFTLKSMAYTFRILLRVLEYITRKTQSIATKYTEALKWPVPK